MKSRTLILAGTYEQACQFADSRGLNDKYEGWSYINSGSGIHRIRGISGGTLYVVGTARGRADYERILLEATAREWTIEDLT